MSKSGSWINNHLFTYTPYSVFSRENQIRLLLWWFARHFHEPKTSNVFIMVNFWWISLKIDQICNNSAKFCITSNPASKQCIIIVYKNVSVINLNSRDANKKMWPNSFKRNGDNMSIYCISQYCRRILLYTEKKLLYTKKNCYFAHLNKKKIITEQILINFLY